jgi:hypothetical protein
MNKDTGAPAFPVAIVNRPKELAHFNGMTLRDYFAAKAMQGFISAKAWHPDFVFGDDWKWDAGMKASEAVGKAAYQYADAMLKARE